MVTWSAFAAERPDLAEASRGLLYQFGVGLGFLATVRPDGGPRVHPMCPILAGDGLYALIVPSPKAGDLIRDGRYALHSFPCPDNEDACYLTGTARECTDAALRDAIEDQFVAERQELPIPKEHLAEQLLVELDIDTGLITTSTGHGDPNPQHTVWHAPPG